MPELDEDCERAGCDGDHYVAILLGVNPHTFEELIPMTARRGD